MWDNELMLQRELDNLSTGQLRSMLHAETEKEVPDDDLVLSILHILEDREPEAPDAESEKQKAAVQMFRKRVRARRKGKWVLKSNLLRVASALLVICLLFAMVPSGVLLTNMVEDTFSESIDQSFAAVEKFSEEVEDSENEDTAQSGLKQFISGITDGVSRMFDTAKNLLSALTDAVAVLVITTCVIPLITMLFFMWLIKTLFGYQIKLPPPRRLPHPPAHADLPERT